MRRAARRGLGLVGLGALLVSAARADERVHLAPTPAWVDVAALPDDSRVPHEQIEGGVYYLLWDRQVQAAAGVRYERVAHKIVNTSGVQNASEIKLAFDPSYERLVFHHVRLLRDGRDTAAFRLADVKVVHEETDLDEQLYNGSLSALLFLKDVRPGDVVDYAYSVEGRNPILGGRYTDRLALAFGVPVRRLRQRVVWPSARKLYVRCQGGDLQPRVEERAGLGVYTWERDDVAAVTLDSGAPGWFDPFPEVQVGDFASWAEVARWARDVFARQDRPSPRLRALAAGWRRAHADDEQAARRAVRFVQDEVRYLGLEMGPHSHRPHAPDDVLARRFGDCKDKALLLSVLLREMGLDAAPALVNTRARRALDQQAPSPFAFDHAIVELRLGGRSLWIDGTQAHQGGRLTEQVVPPFERALVLRAQTEGLARIEVPAPAAPLVSVLEAYALEPDGRRARLDVTTTYRGAEADSLRASLAESSVDSFATTYLEHYAASDPDVRALAPPSFQDDRESNVVVARESYALPRFWSEGRRQFHSWLVADKLAAPEKRLRSSPLACEHPAELLHTITVTLPRVPDVGRDDETYDGEAFSVQTQTRPDGRVLELRYSFRSKRDFLPAEATRAHVEAQRQARDGLWYTLRESDVTGVLPARSSRRGGDAWLGFGVLGALAGGATWGAVRGLRRWRRRRGFVVAGRSAPGSTPASALAAAGEDEVERRARARTCRCGEPCATAVIERQAVSYDGTRLSVAGVRCAACGHEQHVYFRLAPAATRAAD